MSSVLDRVKSLMGSVSAAAREYRALGEQLAKAKERRTFLQTAPRPRACTLATLDNFIDRTYQDRFDEQAQKVLERMQGNPCDAVTMHGNFDPLLQITSGPSLTYLLTIVLKSELKRVAETMTWPGECGPVARERVAEIAKLDKQIADLEREIEEVRSAADQAGVIIGG